MSLLLLTPHALPQLPRRLQDQQQGPEDWNPARGTGCARLNAERMKGGAEADYWEGGFYFETFVDGWYEPGPTACFCLILCRRRLICINSYLIFACHRSASKYITIDLGMRMKFDVHTCDQNVKLASDCSHGCTSVTLRLNAHSGAQRTQPGELGPHQPF